MNRALTVSLAMAICILLVLVPPSQISGKGYPKTPESNVTYVTFRVLGDIKDTLDIGFSHELNETPSTAGSLDSAWNFGTIAPEKGVFTANEFSGLTTEIKGYSWVMNYQSNDYVGCEIENCNTESNDISVIKPFFLIRTKEQLGFGPYFFPESNLLPSSPIPPTYGNVLTFPMGIKVDMNSQENNGGIDPWSIKAGKYGVEIKSKWFLWQSENGDPRQSPIITRTSYAYLTIADAISNRLGAGVNESSVLPPEENASGILQINEEWKGKVYLWVLNYKANSDFDIELHMPPVTFCGEKGGLDIRKYMKHYAWANSGLESVGCKMYPPDKGLYVSRMCIDPTYEDEISFPQGIEVDIPCSGEDPDCWKTRAGIYKPTNNILLIFLRKRSNEEEIIHTLEVDPLAFQTVIPKRQNGYGLPGLGEFSPEEGVRPGEWGSYKHTILCNQNHDRNVELAWEWAKGKAGKGELLWRIFWKDNVEDGITGEGQIWKGIFTYNAQGTPSGLGYFATYEPSWTDSPGDKELIITMSHSPVL